MGPHLCCVGRGGVGEERSILLVPPGKIVCMMKTGEADSGSGSGKYEAYEVPQTCSTLNRIELSDSMIQDHYLTSYFLVLNLSRGLPPPEAECVLVCDLWKKEGGKRATAGRR